MGYPIDQFTTAKIENANYTLDHLAFGIYNDMMRTNNLNYKGEIAGLTL